MARILAQILAFFILFAGFTSAVEAYVVHASDDQPTYLTQQQVHSDSETADNGAHGCCHVSAHLMGCIPATQASSVPHRRPDALTPVATLTSIISLTPTPPPRA